MQHSDGAQQEGLLPTTPSSMAPLGAIATSQPTVAQLRVTGRLPLVTAASAIGVVSAGQVRPVALSPQAAVMVPTQAVSVSRLLSPATSLSAASSATVHIPATLNVLQRQLAAPGVVGLSAVSAQDLQHVLQQASQQSITLLTATDHTAGGGETNQHQQQLSRLARPTRPVSLSQPSPVLPSGGSVWATGATIHHHGQSPGRGASTTPPYSNPPHTSLLTMNINQQKKTTTTTAIPVATTNIAAQSRTVLEVRAPSGQPPSLRTASSSGAPPRKKARLEEKAPPNAQVGVSRKKLTDLKTRQMKELKAEYFEKLTELFFLQNGQNLMDYHAWKKRPTPQLLSFLTSGRLDSDEEEDLLQVKEINSEVKVLTNPGSNVPLATPVAISTTLPPMVSALSHQVVAPSALTASAGTTTLSSTTTTSHSAPSSSSAANAMATSSSQLQQQLSRTADCKGGIKG